MNSAAPAVRDPYSATWFDWDATIGASLPGAFARTDFDNHGDFAALPNHARAGDFVDLTLGGTLQFGGLGVSATGDLQQFSLTTTAGAPGLTMQVGRWKGLGAYGLFGGQLALGGGMRVLTLQIQQAGGGTLLRMAGLAPEVGALWMPTGRPWRVGATVRAPVSGGIGLFGSEHVTLDSNQARSVGQFVLPSQVVMPWEVELGVAYQLGPRPLNPGWLNPHEQEAWLRDRIARARVERAAEAADELAALPPEDRASRRGELEAEERSLRAIENARLDAEIERLRKVRAARYANWPREKILLLASVLLTGPSMNAVSVEGFLDQRMENVGRSTSVTPRLGMEGEPVPDHVVVRVGTYVEPSRYDGGTPRQHFTFGGDVRLFPLDFWGLLPQAQWKLTMVVDLAPRYASAGLSIGEWH